MIVGLMFHHFHGEDCPPVQGSLSADDLRRILDRWRDRLIPAKDVFDAPEGVVLTFDDGLVSQMRVARPVLEEYGVTALWFPCTAPLVGVLSRYEYFRWIRTTRFSSVEAFYDALAEQIGGLPPAPPGYLAAHTYLSPEDRAFRYWRDVTAGPVSYERILSRFDPGNAPPLFLSEADVRALHNAGHVIGCHSHSHPMTFAGMTMEQQEVEYATATWILARITGERPRAVSHPCGHVTTYGLQVLDGLGYTLGFRSVAEAGAGRLLCPRLNSADLRRER